MTNNSSPNSESKKLVTRGFLLTLLFISTLILAAFLSIGLIHDSANRGLSSLLPVQFGFSSFNDQDRTVRDTVRYIFVGANKCAAECHNTEKIGYQYDIWEKSRHSKAFESLGSDLALQYAKRARINGNPKENEVCLKCHITGQGFAGKSFSPTYSKEEGVTCEACHKEEYITKTQWIGKHTPNSEALQPDKKTCLMCHNNPVHKVKKFDYELSVSKISHLLPRYK